MCRTEAGILFFDQRARPRKRPYIYVAENMSIFYGGRKGPSHHSLTDALPYFHRHFHTSIGASLLPSALPRFHTSIRELHNLLRMRKACIVFCSCAKGAQMSGCARLYVCTNAHEVKSWMANNRQGPCQSFTHHSVP